MANDENHTIPEKTNHSKQEPENEDPAGDIFAESLPESEPSEEAGERPEEEERVVQEKQKGQGVPVEERPTTLSDDEEEERELKIFAVTTPIGQERAAADSMLPRINPAKQGIVSLLCPTKLRGFILIEAYDVRELKRIVKGVPKVRRVVEGEREISIEEVEKFLTPKPVLEGIRPGNIVELVSGPFKGEKAKVQHVDNDKEEITVELFEAMVPIPVTVKGEHVRLVER